MSLVQALYGSVCGSFGMLLFAGTVLVPSDITAGSIGTNSVEPSSIDRSAVEGVDVHGDANLHRSLPLVAIRANAKNRHDQSAGTDKGER